MVLRGTSAADAHARHVLCPVKLYPFPRVRVRNINLTCHSPSCYNPIGAARLSGRKEADGAWLLPSFLQKGVMIMTDYEILAIVLLIVTLAFTVHNGTHM